MWHCPIYGSQINPPARLYKRFTTAETLTVQQLAQPPRELSYENNRYVSYAAFPWIEADDLQEDQFQPVDGLMLDVAHMSIKCNAEYRCKRGTVDRPENGDIVELLGAFWAIEDGVQAIRHKMLHNVATLYLPLRRLF